MNLVRYQIVVAQPYQTVPYWIKGQKTGASLHKLHQQSIHRIVRLGTHQHSLSLLGKSLHDDCKGLCFACAWRSVDHVKVISSQTAYDSSSLDFIEVVE